MAALAAAVFSSCSKDSENASVNEGNAIEFRAVTEKQRASLISSTAELTEFLVKADKGDEDFSFMPGTVVSKHTGSWSYSPKKYYPTTAGTTVDFYAHYPIVDPNMTAQMAYDGSGDVTFEYLVPADQSAADATDLLVASVLAKSTGTVAFDFNHALCAVMVTATNANTADASELSYVVSKIEITDLNTTGTYTFGAATPWAVSVPATYTAKMNPTSVLYGGVAQPLLTDTNYLMVLPQTIASTSKLQVTYTITDGAGVEETVVKEFDLATNTNLAAGFEAGKRYNFTFTFSAREGIVFDVTSVVGWDDVTA